MDFLWYYESGNFVVIQDVRNAYPLKDTFLLDLYTLEQNLPIFFFDALRDMYFYRSNVPYYWQSSSPVFVKSFFDIWEKPFLEFPQFKISLFFASGKFV